MIFLGASARPPGRGHFFFLTTVVSRELCLRRTQAAITAHAIHLAINHRLSWDTAAVGSFKPLVGLNSVWCGRCLLVGPVGAGWEGPLLVFLFCPEFLGFWEEFMEDRGSLCCYGKMGMSKRDPGGQWCPDGTCVIGFDGGRTGCWASTSSGLGLTVASSQRNSCPLTDTVCQVLRPALEIHPHHGPLRKGLLWLFYRRGKLRL